MTTTALVHYIGATEKSRSVVASVAADLRDAGEEVCVVDISDTTVISQDFPPAWLIRLLGHRITSPGLIGIFESLGVTYLRPEFPSSHQGIRPAHREALAQALESELLTYFRLDSIPSTREARVLSRRLRVEMEKTYAALDELWSHKPPARALIPNGRTSRQKAARLVAEHHGIQVGFYENGRATPDHYYLGTTQPHDRLASQEEVNSVVASLEPGRTVTLADSWISHRMSGDEGTNQFSSGWVQPEEAPTPGDPGHKAVFFTSSFDEYRAFGPMWSIDNWSHQFEAFDAMMTILEERGVGLVLRLHPNLGSKSRAYFQREVTDALDLQSRHPTLVLHWHNSSVNSYDLVRQADFVIVERSTIGLEAILMGKPVWVTQASQWDQVADVRQVLSPADITGEVMQPWNVSRVGAQNFAAYWMVQEHPLRWGWSTWSTWDPGKAPLRMKIALLAAKNPWSHKVRLVRIVWTAWRNSKFRPPGQSAESQ